MAAGFRSYAFFWAGGFSAYQLAPASFAFGEVRIYPAVGGQIQVKPATDGEVQINRRAE